MTIDILIAVKPHEIRASISTLTSLVLDCDVPCRVAVLLHGGVRKAFLELDDFILPSEVQDDKENMHRFTWAISHEQRTLTFAEKLTRLGVLKKNKFAVLAFPGLVTNDPKWFGKLQQTFMKDPRNMLTIVLPLTNANLHPARLEQNAAVAGPMIMGGPDLPTILGRCSGGEENFATDLKAMTKTLGGNRWSLESIRHVVLEVESPEEKKDHAW